MIKRIFVQASVQWIPSSRQDSCFGRFKGTETRRGRNLGRQGENVREEPRLERENHKYHVQRDRRICGSDQTAKARLHRASLWLSVWDSNSRTTTSSFYPKSLQDRGHCRSLRPSNKSRLAFLSFPSVDGLPKKFCLILAFVRQVYIHPVIYEGLGCRCGSRSEGAFTRRGGQARRQRKLYEPGDVGKVRTNRE